MIKSLADMQARLERDLGETLRPDTEIHCGSRGIIETVSGSLYFLKCGAESATYEREARGLEELAAAGEIKTAVPCSCGSDYILTGYIIAGAEDEGFFEKFGRQLARLHRHTAESFGFEEDNFIGRTPQHNIASGDERSDWTSFFLNKRLLYQFRLAESKGYGDRLTAAGFGRLEKRIPEMLAGAEEPPALLHGDLWRGNYICDTDNDPVLIDPAVYYGHREADIAMTLLFGGFPAEFYDAYNEEFPLADGWRERADIYNLYHLLNHLNTFGRGYLIEAESVIERLTS